MKKLTQNEIIGRTYSHDLWLSSKGEKGEKADLSHTDLSGVDLSNHNLAWANLYRANLAYANLTGANLTGANLKLANLYRANLTGANLTGANLTEANLTEANLTEANLTGANLARANLTEANLTEANLTGANLKLANLYRANLARANLTEAVLPNYQIVPETGSFQCWKDGKDEKDEKSNKVIIKLEVPVDAKRTSCLINRKCRCEFAKVVSIETLGGERIQSCLNSGSGSSTPLTYTVGEVVYPDSYDDDIRVDCTHGIHFFMTKKEAIEW